MLLLSFWHIQKDSLAHFCNYILLKWFESLCDWFEWFCLFLTIHSGTGEFTKIFKNTFLNRRHPEDCPCKEMENPGAFGQSCFVEYPFPKKVQIFFCKCSWLRSLLIKSQGVPLNVTGTGFWHRRFPWSFPIFRSSHPEVFC